MEKGGGKSRGKETSLAKPSVLLMEPNLQLRKKLANFYRLEGLTVFEAVFPTELHEIAALCTHPPKLIVVKLERNRHELHLQLLKLQSKQKIKIPVVILARELESEDLLPMVEVGARSVILNLENEKDWQAKLRHTLSFVRQTK